MSIRPVIFLLAALLLSLPSSAQLLTVTGEFRVVEVDVPNMRLGVARLEADPEVRQNWVSMRANTKITVREEAADGTFRDKQENVEEVMSKLRPGHLVRVHGGRGFDGGISARTLSYTRAAEVASSAGSLEPLAGLPQTGQSEPTPASQGSDQDLTLTYPETTWSGTVLETSPEGLLLEVAPDQVVRVPASAMLSSGNSPIILDDLEPGDALKASLPGGTATLVSATNQVTTLQSPQGLLQIPTSSLSQQVRDNLQVPVLTKGGSELTLPLSSALSMQASDGAMIVGRSLLRAGAAPSVPGTGVMLQALSDGALVLTPEGQLLRLAGGTSGYLPGSGISFDPTGGSVKVNPLKKANLLKGTPGKGKGGGKGKGKGRPGF